MKISIVIPVFHNADSLPKLHQMLREQLGKLGNYEIIFVDDGSKDDSYEVIKSLRKTDERVKLIRLSRNFGSISAQFAGLNYASGDCVAVISADMQDHPEIILRLHEKWLQGNKVCLAVRSNREDGFVQKIISNLFYKIMKKIALKNMPEHGFDCFLIDRKVVEILKNLEEKNSSIICQILWCGFQTAQIEYVRKRREVGKSRWTLAKKIKYFIDSILSFSYVPIRLVSLVGIVISFFSFLLICLMILQHFLGDIPVRGWASLVCLILFTFGIQLIILGMVGEYLWRTLDQSRKRPIFIIEDKEGIDL